MKNLVLIILVCFIMSCSNDDINVVLNNSSVTTLTFTNNGSPVSNSEIRVAPFSTGTFQFGNSFEGVTDNNGTIEVGPLNSGTYFFRLDMGTQGFFIESFEVISGNSSSRNFDLAKYSSKAEFEIENLDPNFDYNAINYYMAPYSIPFTGNNNEQLLANAVQGSFNTDKIEFSSIVSGAYYFFFEVNEELFPYNFYTVQRDYDLSVDIFIPEELILSMTNWTVSRTTGLNSGNEVSDVITSVRFDAQDVKFTFSDNTTFSTGYFTSTFTNGEIYIYLSDPFVDKTDIRLISSMEYRPGSGLSIMYDDEFFIDYLAILN